VQDTEVVMQIWDTAGQERYSAFANISLKFSINNASGRVVGHTAVVEYQMTIFSMAVVDSVLCPYAI
jgi:GTPase SAR1 family protein